MKWYRAKAYRREQTGIDELHNPICSTVEAFDFFVRFGPSHKGSQRRGGETPSTAFPAPCSPSAPEATSPASAASRSKGLPTRSRTSWPTATQPS